MHPLPLLARWFAVATAALLLAACAQAPPASPVARPPASPAATAASRTPPLAMLWVGNSFFYYNNSMHGHVGQLLRASMPKAAAAGARPRSPSAAPGLDWHDLEALLQARWHRLVLVRRQERSRVQRRRRALPKLFDAVHR